MKTKAFFFAFFLVALAVIRIQSAPVPGKPDFSLPDNAVNRRKARRLHSPVQITPTPTDNQDNQSNDVIQYQPEPTSPSKTTPSETKAQEEIKPKKGMVYIKFREGNIKEMVKEFSELLGKNFTYDDGIKGQVTLIGEQEVTKWQARKIFESALERMGYAVIWGWPINKIVPISQAKTSGNVPVIE